MTIVNSLKITYLMKYDYVKHAFLAFLLYFCSSR